MKLFDIIWKEISLIKAQKIAIALIFLYPFIVVGLLGSAFTGVDISRMNQIKIGFVNNLNFESEIVDSLVTSYSNLSITQYDNEDLLRAGLYNKQVISGVILRGDAPNKQLKVDLLYDNSNLLSSRFFMEIAKALIQKTTSDYAQKNLGRIWTTIKAFGSNIDEEIRNVEDFKSQLSSAELALDDLELKLNAVEYKEGDVNSVRASFNKFKSEYESLKGPLAQNKETLKKLPGQIDEASVLISSIVKNLEYFDSVLLQDSDKNLLNEQISHLNSINSKMSKWKSMSLQLITITEKISDETSEINKSFSKVDAIFEKATLGARSIEEVKELIASARESKITIESKLDSSSALLSKFSKELVEFSKIDPKVLAQPVIFYEGKIYNVDPFGILVSNALVVVLILTCMLLTSIIFIMEKTENVTLRLELSPTSKFILFLGKIIGQLVIALIEAGIIFVVAFAKIPLPFSILGVTHLGFGLVTSANLFELFLAVVLVSLTFICLGLFIASLVKNQSTAILTSLLVIVPMLFLSGIVLPLEFMEPTMQLVSSILPMTLANNLLIGLIIKGLTISQLWFEAGLLLFYSLLSFGVVFFKTKL
ncbi:MAG: ABC transporter permease [Candidatus Diapherotrites archaeon]|uniref:ABC transporter permease n=1 Tax=Candidatus Iainarchaeum sp. TaxID=3101447 RepID=A0A7K4BYH2_9ARCH|nr:ABC transporter permease [Candidatus Diapherotrites archaeon]